MKGEVGSQSISSNDLYLCDQQMGTYSLLASQVKRLLAFEGKQLICANEECNPSDTVCVELPSVRVSIR